MKRIDAVIRQENLDSVRKRLTGNPFVVPAPPDPSAPDYADKKKAYD